MTHGITYVRRGSATSVSNVCYCQNGTSEHDYIDAAAAGPDGTYVFVGSTRGNWSAANAGLEDWIVFKVDAQRDILWTWQVVAGLLHLEKMQLSRR